MARDPLVPLTDVQWVLGHAQLSTTQIYLTQGSGIASDGRAESVFPRVGGLSLVVLAASARGFRRLDLIS